MKRETIPVAVLILLLATGLNVPAQETNSSSRLDYPTFRIISERNIFNANRSTRSSRRGEPERQVRIESFTLLGTLSYEKGSFAFFEGTSSEYRKALKPSDTIARYRIVDITPTHIKLTADGKDMELRVGMQMKKEDEGEWQMTARAESSGNASQPATSTDKAASTDKTDASSNTGSGGEESDVLKRLLQKREQEMKNENR